MARVTGIGGVFFKARDPKALMKWYGDVLGCNLSEYGFINFEWKDEVPAGTGTTTFSAFKEDSDHFGDSGQRFMFNLRVDDMDALLKKLEAEGVWIDPKRDSADYGHFAWIKDIEGNRVELWQPL